MIYRLKPQRFSLVMSCPKAGMKSYGTAHYASALGPAAVFGLAFSSSRRFPFYPQLGFYGLQRGHGAAQS